MNDVESEVFISVLEKRKNATSTGENGERGMKRYVHRLTRSRELIVYLNDIRFSANLSRYRV